MRPRILVRNAGPGALEFLGSLWHETWYRTSSPQGHMAYRMRLFTCSWGRRHTQVLVLEEGGKPRSGLIVHKLPMRYGGRPLRVAGIAAVVTDPAHRARGFGSELIRVAHRRLSDAGFDAALLFSEIGPRYYIPLGYMSLPTTRHVLAVGDRPARAGVTIRPARPADLRAQKALYDSLQSAFALTLRRPLDYWRYSLLRARLKHVCLAPVGPGPETGAGPGFESGSWLAIQGGRAVAYASLVKREDDLILTDAGHEPGRAGALSAIIADRARSAGVGRVTVLAPPSIAEGLELPVIHSERVDQMMLAPLGGKAPGPANVDAVEHCVWPEDWF